MSGAVTTKHSSGSTAYWTAAVRAMKYEREGRLFSDPWTRGLAGEVGEEWIAGRSAESVIPISLRPRFSTTFSNGLPARM